MNVHEHELRHVEHEHSLNIKVNIHCKYIKYLDLGGERSHDRIAYTKTCQKGFALNC